VNSVALCSKSSTCFAICSGWPVTICGSTVIGPPEDAVASIALEFGKVSIAPTLVGNRG
jgi:signal transduction protein with GAF and PtsI domain